MIDDSPDKKLISDDESITPVEGKVRFFYLNIMKRKSIKYYNF